MPVSNTVYNARKEQNIVAFTQGNTYTWNNIALEQKVPT